MPDAAVVPSIAQIGREAWNACYGRAVEDYDYLLAVEQAGLEGFQWRYVAVFDGARPLVAAPGFLTRYSLDTTLNRAGRSLVAGARRLVPNAFSIKLACLGSPCTETGAAGWPDHVPHNERGPLLSRLLAAFEAEARREGCGLMAVKDVPEREVDLWREATAPHAYGAAPGLPAAALDIDFSSLDGWLERLTYSQRKDMRRKLRSGAAVRTEMRSELGALIGPAMALYEQTLERTDMSLERLTPAYFQGVARIMAGRAFFRLFWIDDRLAGFNLLIEDKGVLLDKYFCMGAEGRRHNLYFLSWFANVQHCIDRGLRQYRSGQAGHETKQRLGSRLEPTTHFFRHRWGLANAALQLAAPFFVQTFDAAAAA